jgi:putative ABC transport system ATP-binding protein
MGTQHMREIISTRGLVKHYRMGDTVIRALDDVSLAVADNEWVAIMGPSGSGKSTLMNILGCLVTPDEGSYQLNGVEIGRMDDDALALTRSREIGFVFQSFNLQHRRTALQNVMTPLRFTGTPKAERAERATRLLVRLGMADRMGHRPNEMSGGQRQRVAIARALVNQPSILLADEPTGNLDSRTSAEIMALFGELHDQGQTIVLVTHENEVAAHANRIVRLRDGRIAIDQTTGVNA